MKVTRLGKGDKRYPSIVYSSKNGKDNPIDYSDFENTPGVSVDRNGQSIKLDASLARSLIEYIGKPYKMNSDYFYNRQCKERALGIQLILISHGLVNSSDCENKIKTYLNIDESVLLKENINYAINDRIRAYCSEKGIIINLV